MRRLWLIDTHHPDRIVKRLAPGEASEVAEAVTAMRTDEERTARKSRGRESLRVAEGPPTAAAVMVTLAAPREAGRVGWRTRAVQQYTSGS